MGRGPLQSGLSPTCVKWEAYAEISVLELDLGLVYPSTWRILTGIKSWSKSRLSGHR